jgi:PAS domain S-box-containing protein
MKRTHSALSPHDLATAKRSKTVQNKLSMQQQIATFSKQIKRRSDLLVNYFLAGYFIIGILLAFFYDTWLIALGVASLSLFAYYVSKLALPASDLYQYVLSVIIGIFMAQFIYQMHGMFEMHFFAFIGSAILIAYRNWKLQIPLAIVVFIHHAAFGYLQFAGFDKIFFTQLDYMSLQTFLIHCSLAASIFILCGRWAYNFKKSERELIEKSFEIATLQEAGRQKDVLVAISDNLRRSNKRLREVNNDLARIFNTVEEVLFSIDMTTRKVIQKSMACERIYGYTPEEFYADPRLWIKIIHPEDRSIIEIMYTKLNCRVMAVNQYRIIHKNKSIRWIEAKVIPGFDVKGKLTRIDGTCNDITARIELQEKLSQEIKQRQQEITAAVISAQEMERSVLGEELHDNINQILATAKLYIGSALADEKSRIELMKESRGFINNAMDEIRKLSKTLAPPSLGKVSLTDAITDITDSIKQVNELKFMIKWEHVDENLLSEKLQLTIFRIVQEQLNNILKHSGATSVYITLKQSEESINLIIRDDGVGFDVLQRRDGVGLQNMTSRAELLHGNVNIVSRPGEGCELNIDFSLTNAFIIAEEKTLRA